ncbi:uncharacterized protein LOC119163200 isoform X1 [Rhipicephalus microplus]|uniref:uncharacterized protein LOC119163200 isoform X1 n=2 Tax=Rhipicephalus microplus TaxID=6941 RepID=UPI003F6C3912
MLSDSGFAGGRRSGCLTIEGDLVANTGMAQKRCLCGQVANMDAASQMPGWKVRREVSIQCNLLPPPAPPLISCNPGSATLSRTSNLNDSHHFLSREAVDQHSGMSETFKKVSSSSGATDSAEEVSNNSRSTDRTEIVGSYRGATDSVVKDSNSSGATDSAEKVSYYSGATNRVEKVSNHSEATDNVEKVNSNSGAVNCAKKASNVIQPTAKGKWRFCQLCPFKTKLEYAFKTHVLAHIGNESTECPICLAKFTKTHDIFCHMQQVHLVGELYRCDLCPCKTLYKNVMEKHKRVHATNKVYTCDVCPYVSVHRSRMNKHKLTHTGAKPFICEMCPFACATRRTLSKHMLRMHPES